jgi:hypothetical protein
MRRGFCTGDDRRGRGISDRSGEAARRQARTGGGAGARSDRRRPSARTRAEGRAPRPALRPPAAAARRSRSLHRVRRWRAAADSADEAAAGGSTTGGFSTARPRPEAPRASAGQASALASVALKNTLVPELPLDPRVVGVDELENAAAAVGASPDAWRSLHVDEPLAAVYPQARVDGQLRPVGCPALQIDRAIALPNVRHG